MMRTYSIRAWGPRTPFPVLASQPEINMVWIYDGGQCPWPSSGCVIAPGTPRSFGFARTLYWTVSVLSALLLVELSLRGHEVEVLGALLAAWLVGAVVELVRPALSRASGKETQAAGGKTVGGGR